MEPSQQHDHHPITEAGQKEQSILRQQLQEKDDQIKKLEKKLDRKEFDIINLTKTNEELWEDLSKADGELQAEKSKTTVLEKELKIQMERCRRLEEEQKMDKLEGPPLTVMVEGGSPDEERSKEAVEAVEAEMMEEVVEEGEIVEGPPPSCAKSVEIRSTCGPTQTGAVGGIEGLTNKVTPVLQSRKRKLEQSTLTSTARNDSEAMRLGTKPVADREGQNSKQVKSLPPLPALVFQFQSTQIRMAMFKDGESKILENSCGSKSTPFVVGLTANGRLEYGNAVTGNITSESTQVHPSFKEHWWVTDHFIKGGDEAWSGNILLPDGDTHQMTVELLIGFVLKSLKGHAEFMLNGNCGVAVIAIPFWYNSTQRIQVKDGGRLAGFTDVILINEASAAAFATQSMSNTMLTSRNVLVLSENSGQIDASIYSRASFGKKRLDMIAHAGHYFEVNGGTGKGAPLTSSAEKEKLVHKMCTEVLQKVLNMDISPPVELIVFAESWKWKAVLEQVGRKHVFRINKESDPLLGAAFLSQEPFQIGQIISDKLAHDVLGKCDSERSNITIISKEDFMLPVQSECEIVSHSLPLKCKMVKIFQNWLNGPIEILKLSVNPSIPSNQRIAINLSVTNDGIVDMMDVTLLASTCRTSTSMDNAREEDYSWSTPNLTPENFGRTRALLEYFSNQVATPSEISYRIHPLALAKQSLLLKCKEMTEQRKGFTYKSDMVKDTFVKTIESSVSLTDKPNVTVEEIHEQIEILSKWGDKYME